MFSRPRPASIQDNPSADLRPRQPGRPGLEDRAHALAASGWTYGDTRAFRAGMFDRLPDLSGTRQLETGTRLADCGPPADIPLVSIVTVVWNNTDSLQRCIESVRQQSYGAIEHIIIDGGSDQPTLEILQRNAEHLAYVVSEQDHGIYAAMNKGIAVAQGAYICLLNSDDVYDPSFVERAVAAAQERPDAIIHTDYFAGSTHLPTTAIDIGVLFGHLNICHNTFLVPRAVYDRVGPFDEDYRIVSDAVWIRRAWLMAVDFHFIATPLFTLSEGGLSSGTSEKTRRIFIAEMAQSYRQVFPELSPEDAEAIYMFRFNKDRIPALLRVIAAYPTPALRQALRSYASYCLSTRANFALTPADLARHLPNYIALIEALDISLRALRLPVRHGTLTALLDQIDVCLARRKPLAEKRILHFITVFSAPSETFIYDLVQRLEAEADLDNFVLFEHALLQTERPYGKALQISWADYPELLATHLYNYILSALQPDVVIAHFALNEWKWSKRIARLPVSIPTISMCHGIDVFSLKTQDDYRQHVLETFCRRDDTAFTAVSAYLRQEMIAHGLPAEKIHPVHNVVHPRYFQHRKTGDFYKGQRPLKLLAVGRLIAWKGHHHLLEALKQLEDSGFKDFELTIVYGNGAEELEALKAQAQSLGIAAKITFVPFINFAEQPGYFANFDLFVHPSVYSNDVTCRTETFGVSVLEAIAAGLPVITSDAGGLPEVVGEGGVHARIVPHGDATALAQALRTMRDAAESFSDNLSYAEERLAAFSERHQLDLLRELISKVTAPRIKAALFSSSTIQGAGYAAFRVHKGLRATSITPHLFTTTRNHAQEADVTVIAPPAGQPADWRRLQLQPAPGLTIFTVNDDLLSSSKLLESLAEYDIINLHWHARFLSLDNIATLTQGPKPVVMTVRDMMPLTGGCHTFHGCSKWQDSCLDCPQLPEALKDYPSSVLALKRSSYDFSNLTLVAISNHSRRILQRTPYFRDCRIEVIPNSIELDVFHPHDPMEMRREFGLPLDRKIIGYVPSYSSEVKGYREITAALQKLHQRGADRPPHVMLIGPDTPATEDIPFEKTSLGYIQDNARLARAYSCADVIVVPSLEETFSNTTAEAIACGVPVVGFRTGAIPDLAVAGISGMACEVGNVAELADAIDTVLSGPSLRASSRRHAEAELSFMRQALAYEALFKELVGAQRRQGRAIGTGPAHLAQTSEEASPPRSAPAQLAQRLERLERAKIADHIAAPRPPTPTPPKIVAAPPPLKAASPLEGALGRELELLTLTSLALTAPQDLAPQMARAAVLNQPTTALSDPELRRHLQLCLALAALPSG